MLSVKVARPSKFEEIVATFSKDDDVVIQTDGPSFETAGLQIDRLYGLQA